jgi:hypothetical protein
VIATPKLSERDRPQRKRSNVARLGGSLTAAVLDYPTQEQPRSSYLEDHFYAGGNSLMHVRHAPLFVFASFGCVNAQRAVRVFFECNTRASNAQRAIHAASACNMRASTRASVFGGAHAFSCWSLRNILRKLEGEGPKFFAGRGESFRFGWPICSKMILQPVMRLAANV